MQIVYAFIYYYTFFWVSCICLLAIFFIPYTRRLLVKFWRNYQHLIESDIFTYTVFLSYLIIGFVFLQSSYTLLVLQAHFSKRSQRLLRRMGGLENIDLVVPQSDNREGYLMALKQYREFFLAQRNIMLVLSALFTKFVFQRLLYNIRRYAELQHDIIEVRDKGTDPKDMTVDFIDNREAKKVMKQKGGSGLEAVRNELGINHHDKRNHRDHHDNSAGRDHFKRKPVSPEGRHSKRE